MLAGVLALALAASAAAADTPVTSADLVTPGDQYPMPKGLHSWATVLADIFVNKVIPHCVPFLLQNTWRCLRDTCPLQPQARKGHANFNAPDHAHAAKHLYQCRNALHLSFGALACMPVLCRLGAT